MPRFDLPPHELARYRPDIREPEDFDAFWQSTLAGSRQVGGEILVSPRRQPDDRHRRVRRPGFAGDPVKAWLWAPRGATGPLPVRYLRVHRGSEEQVFDTLSSFDGATFAARIHAPALFSVGLHDLTCPPSTVYAAYNHLASETREIDVYPFNEHEGGQAYRWPAQAAFAAAHL